jgi:hypothetical protein
MVILLSFYVWMIILSIYLSIYLSISYVYEMKCVVVPLYLCYIDLILCIFHTILSHDYTHPFRHPTFYKIIQLSSHMPLSMTFSIINPCIYLGGGLFVQIWKTKLYYT